MGWNIVGGEMAIPTGAPVPAGPGKGEECCWWPEDGAPCPYGGTEETPARRGEDGCGRSGPGRGGDVLGPLLASWDSSLISEGCHLELGNQSINQSINQPTNQSIN